MVAQLLGGGRATSLSRTRHIVFGSLLGIATDIVKIAAAPVEIAADLTRAVTKPIADAATETAKAVKTETKDLLK